MLFFFHNINKTKTQPLRCTHLRGLSYLRLPGYSLVASHTQPDEKLVSNLIGDVFVISYSDIAIKSTMKDPCQTRD